jgi:hypothetical protein
MGKPEIGVSQLCKEIGVARQTMYHHVGPEGFLRVAGRACLAEQQTARKTLTPVFLFRCPPIPSSA